MKFIDRNVVINLNDMAQLSLSLAFNIRFSTCVAFICHRLHEECFVCSFIRINLEANLFLQSPDFSVKLN